MFVELTLIETDTRLSIRKSQITAILEGKEKWSYHEVIVDGKKYAVQETYDHIIKLIKED